MDSTNPFPPPQSYDKTPPLRGRRVLLRTPRSSDYDFLYAISTAPENIVRWRYRGTTPSPELFNQTMWQGVLAQFVVVTRAGTPIGLVSAYNANLRSQTAYVATIFAPEYEGRGWTLDGVTLFLTYLFETFGLRKIYYEMLEFNYARIASGSGRHFHVEGCLRDHEFHDGRFWHWYLLAVYRDEYESFVSPYLDRILDDGREE